jgi:hypothetical protein
VVFSLQRVSSRKLCLLFSIAFLRHYFRAGSQFQKDEEADGVCVRVHANSKGGND